MLIVDDSIIDRTLLVNAFACSYNVLEATNGRDALTQLAQHKVDIVISDIDMKEMNGFDLIKAMKKNPSLADIPIIIETCESAHEESALLSGADDFIAKPFNFVVARKRVDNIVRKHVLEREQLQTALRKTKLVADQRTQELFYAAKHDQLTGLLNRVAFCQSVAKLLEDHPDKEYAIVRFDIERFKIINELYGSSKGDEILKAVARYLEHYAESQGACARLEADHFALCLPKDIAFGKDYAENLERILETTGIKHRIVLYFGLFEIQDRTMPVDIMCDRANLALRSIKGNYNTRFALYDTNMHQRLILKHQMQEEADQALIAGEFEPFIQPVFDASTGTVVAGEALARWKHPEKGLISPGAFLPFFENSGFIARLDGYMREEVCRILSLISAKGLPQIPLSVNVSRIEFYDPSFCNDLAQLTERYRVSTSSLRLEITESAYTDNFPQLLQAIAELRRLGFTVLMDDFGAGYSSLSMLRDAPVDIIKLDMRFLSGKKEKNEREKIILQSIVPMAKSLNLPIIAEGVETVEQAEFLRSIGCDCIQGYLYAKPMPKDDFIALLSEKNTVGSHRE